MRWFRRSKTPPVEPVDPALADLARQEVARHVAQEGMSLVHVTPDRIGVDSKDRPLKVGPEHVLGCWRYSGEAWEVLPVEAFFEAKRRDKAVWTQYAIRVAGDTAWMYWTALHFFDPGDYRKGYVEGGGGLFRVVRDAMDGWQPRPMLGPSLADLAGDALFQAVFGALAGHSPAREGSLIVQFNPGPPQDGLETLVGCWVWKDGAWQSFPLDEFWWLYRTAHEGWTRFTIQRQATGATIAYAAQTRITYGIFWGGQAIGSGGEYHATRNGDGSWTLALGRVWVN